MNDDIEAIFQEVERLRRSPKPSNKYTPDWKFEMEIQNVLHNLIHPPDVPRYGAVFRAKRFLLARFSRHEILMLGLLVKEKSNTELRLSLRTRGGNEVPRELVKQRRTFELQWRAYNIAAIAYPLMDEGLSEYAAVERARDELRETWSTETAIQHLKILRKHARVRGFVDPFAAWISLLAGIRSDDGLVMSPLTVDRITRKGRPRKKEELSKKQN